MRLRMTLATYITIARLGLVPVFICLAVAYGHSVELGQPREILRWAAVLTYTVAAVSDGVDGAIARHYHQRTKLGAFLDPIADKALLLSGVITLTLVPWGANGWAIPDWFGGLVIARDIIILGGIVIIYQARGRVPIRPHWTGKVCTVTQMVVLGWIMLKWLPFSPQIPVVISGIFLLWSGCAYIKEGFRLLTTKDLI